MQRVILTTSLLLLLSLDATLSAANPAPAPPGSPADAPTPTPAAHALDGTPLSTATLTDEADRRLHADLTAAQAAFEADPSEMNTIWLGRRLAYLQRYREAVDVFSAGLERFPQSYRLYRHRGHRHITLRDFDAAIADFERAYALMPKDVTETEPDGMPNALGIPLSNTQFNVLYHHALAHYLKGEWAAAERLWRECLDYADNPDLQVATRDWLYMTLRRLGEREAAAEIRRRVLGTGAWAAFGYIAAEAASHWLK